MNFMRKKAWLLLPVAAAVAAGVVMKQRQPVFGFIGEAPSGFRAYSRAELGGPLIDLKVPLFGRIVYPRLPPDVLEAGKEVRSSKSTAGIVIVDDSSTLEISPRLEIGEDIVPLRSMFVGGKIAVLVPNVYGTRNMQGTLRYVDKELRLTIPSNGSSIPRDERRASVGPYGVGFRLAESLAPGFTHLYEVDVSGRKAGDITALSSGVDGKILTFVGKYPGQLTIERESLGPFAFTLFSVERQPVSLTARIVRRGMDKSYKLIGPAGKTVLEARRSPHGLYFRTNIESRVRYHLDGITAMHLDPDNPPNTRWGKRNEIWDYLDSLKDGQKIPAIAFRLTKELGRGSIP